MNIGFEPRDVARLNTFDNNMCRKYLNIFKEGDVVERVGVHPSKYYHEECFRPY